MAILFTRMTNRWYPNFAIKRRVFAIHTAIIIANFISPITTLWNHFSRLSQIINLVGSPVQQDVELAALYRDSTANYGEHKVLGILASRWDEPHHKLWKREAKQDDSATSTTPAGPTEEPVMEDAIYNGKDKAIIYMTSAPVLSINSTDEESIVLNKHTTVTYDSREGESTLMVTFKTEDTTKVSRNLVKD